MSQTCSTSAPDFSTPHSANRTATSSRGTLGSKLKLDWSSDVFQTQHSKTGCNCYSDLFGAAVAAPFVLSR